MYRSFSLLSKKFFLSLSLLFILSLGVFALISYHRNGTKKKSNEFAKKATTTFSSPSPVRKEDKSHLAQLPSLLSGPVLKPPSSTPWYKHIKDPLIDQQVRAFFANDTYIKKLEEEQKAMWMDRLTQNNLHLFESFSQSDEKSMLEQMTDQHPSLLLRLYAHWRLRHLPTDPEKIQKEQKKISFLAEDRVHQTFFPMFEKTQDAEKTWLTFLSSEFKQETNTHAVPSRFSAIGKNIFEILKRLLVNWSIIAIVVMRYARVFITLHSSKMTALHNRSIFATLDSLLSESALYNLAQQCFSVPFFQLEKHLQSSSLLTFLGYLSLGTFFSYFLSGFFYQFHEHFFPESSSSHSQVAFNQERIVEAHHTLLSSSKALLALLQKEPELFAHEIEALKQLLYPQEQQKEYKNYLDSLRFYMGFPYWIRTYCLVGTLERTFSLLGQCKEGAPLALPVLGKIGMDYALSRLVRQPKKGFCFPQLLSSDQPKVAIQAQQLYSSSLVDAQPYDIKMDASQVPIHTIIGGNNTGKRVYIETICKGILWSTLGICPADTAEIIIPHFFYYHGGHTDSVKEGLSFYASEVSACLNMLSEWQKGYQEAPTLIFWDNPFASTHEAHAASVAHALIASLKRNNVLQLMRCHNPHTVQLLHQLGASFTLLKKHNQEEQAHYTAQLFDESPLSRELYDQQKKTFEVLLSHALAHDQQEIEANEQWVPSLVLSQAKEITDESIACFFEDNPYIKASEAERAFLPLSAETSKSLGFARGKFTVPDQHIIHDLCGEEAPAITQCMLHYRIDHLSTAPEEIKKHQKILTHLVNQETVFDTINASLQALIQEEKALYKIFKGEKKAFQKGSYSLITLGITLYFVFFPFYSMVRCMFKKWTLLQKVICSIQCFAIQSIELYLLSNSKQHQLQPVIQELKQFYCFLSSAKQLLECIEKDPWLKEHFALEVKHIKALLDKKHPQAKKRTWLECFENEEWAPSKWQVLFYERRYQALYALMHDDIPLLKGAAAALGYIGSFCPLVNCLKRDDHVFSLPTLLDKDIPGFVLHAKKLRPMSLLDGVATDVDLDSTQAALWLKTGPNAAGKTISNIKICQAIVMSHLGIIPAEKGASFTPIDFLYIHKDQVYHSQKGFSMHEIEMKDAFQHGLRPLSKLAPDQKALLLWDEPFQETFPDLMAEINQRFTSYILAHYPNVLQLITNHNPRFTKAMMGYPKVGFKHVVIKWLADGSYRPLFIEEDGPAPSSYNVGVLYFIHKWRQACQEDPALALFNLSEQMNNALNTLTTSR